ncbi:MAG: hypothetical protein IJW30_02615 [Clostridia bacterium]|nr:hypothetical protein [Clostridia bacterium]
MRQGYFISLGGNGGRDTWSHTEHRGPSLCQCTGRYKETPAIDRALLYELIDALPALGIDLVVLDILDAMQYASHPEISLTGAFTHEEMRALLSHMRAIGLEPVPKLNFSSCHDTWLKDYGKMKGTAKYYEVVKDLIDEVCEVFDRPSLFHLGMDEEDLPTHRKALTIIRCNDLWCHDLYFYMDCVQKNGARPWIWGDFYWAHADVFAKKIPKECLISNWWYERVKVAPDGTYLPKNEMDAYVALAELGYDQLPCASTWCCHQSIAQTVLFFKEKNLIDEHLLGFMTAPWTGVAEVNRYTLLDDAYRLMYARKLLE